MPDGDKTLNQEIMDQICDRLMAGESIRSILKTDGFPSTATFFKALRVQENAAWRDQYAHAREDAADVQHAEICDVAHQEPEHGFQGVDSGEVAHRRLLIDTMKWSAGRMKPKVYGDKIQNEHSGPGGSPIQVITNVPTLPAPDVSG